jgi:5-formyltetrahydrofolate cyclo-ligase
VKAARVDLDPVRIDTMSRRIEEAVAGLQEFVGAKTVCVYLPMSGEVRTEGLMERCWEEGKAVCVPAFCAPHGRYRLAAMTPDTQIVSGPWRVPEPARTEWVRTEAVDVILVPGLAFDEAGGRIGHGGGHYDRILGGPGGARLFKVGLAFDFQVFGSVPTDGHDVRLNAVVTETRVLRSANKVGR